MPCSEARLAAPASHCRLLEVFSVEQRDAINARRVAQWTQAIAALGLPQHLMLLIAKVTEIVPARYGFKAVVEHVPDQAFSLDQQLYRRMGRRFESALALWGATDDLLVMIATFSVAAAGRQPGFLRS